MKILTETIMVINVVCMFLPLILVFAITQLHRNPDIEPTLEALILTAISIAVSIMLFGNIPKQYPFTTSLAAWMAFGFEVLLLLKAFISIASKEEERLQQGLVQAVCMIPCAILWVVCNVP